MIDKNLFNDLCVFIRDIFQLDENDTEETVLDSDTSFSEDLYAEPEDLIELGFIIEEEFGVQLPMDVFETLDTLGELTEYISSQMENV